MLDADFKCEGQKSTPISNYLKEKGQGSSDVDSLSAVYLHLYTAAANNYTLHMLFTLNILK